MGTEDYFDEDLYKVLYQKLGPEAGMIFKDNIVGYIAGWIAKTIIIKFDCEMCKELCYTHDLHYAHPTANKLTLLKDHSGALVLPTKPITDLCILIDREIALYEFNGGSIYDKLFDLRMFSRVVDKSDFQQIIPTIDSHVSTLQYFWVMNPFVGCEINLTINEEEELMY